MKDEDWNLKSNSQLAELFLQDVQTKRTKNTLVNYKREVHSFVDYINEMRIGDVKPSILSKWISSREKSKPLSGNTKRVMLSAVGSFMKYIGRNGFVLKYGNTAKDELEDYPSGTGKQHETLSLDQVSGMIRKTSSPREKCLLTIFAKTGARLNEVRSITLSDINLDEGTLWIRNRKGSKNGNKDTCFPIDKELDQVIRAWLGFRRSDNDYLFVSYFGSWLSNVHIGRLVDQAGKRIGMNDVTPHRFRYFFTTYMITEGNLPHPVVTVLRGDKSRDIVGYYTKPSWSYIKDEYLSAVPLLL